jgi:hypothetical protein
MFEFIGLIIGLFVLGAASIIAGGVLAAIGWLLFWGQRRPKLLILLAGAIPPVSLAYILSCAILFSLFVPNQPDEFFGDFKEPLPNGYVLEGLGKMPEYSFFDSTIPGRPQPPLLGGVKRLELDGEVVYGVYGPLNGESTVDSGDHGHFIFNTHDGSLRNMKTLQELNSAAGHAVRFVDSGNFRSREPSRVRLRWTETWIYATPPLVATLLCLILLVRERLSGANRTASV